MIAEVVLALLALILSALCLRLLAICRFDSGKMFKLGFKDKVVWLTGASQGLGAALAVAYAATGSKLILSSRSREALEAVKRRCVQHVRNEDVLVLPFDLCGGEDVIVAAVAKAEAAFGAHGVDVMVHIAGMSQRSLAQFTAVSVLDAMMQLNLTAAVTITQLLLPKMVARRRGQFVVISSLAAVLPSAGQALYACCKAGLTAYFRSVQTELYDKGIGVTICCPGPIEGSELKPRVVMGPTGMTKLPAEATSKKRQSVQRVAELVVRASFHRLDMCWIATFPMLPLVYMAQYLPTTTFNLMKQIGPGRAAAIAQGSSAYDAKKLSKGVDVLAALGWKSQQPRAGKEE